MIQIGKKAQIASERTKEAEAKEKVQVAVMGSYGKNGNLDYKELKTNLDRVEGMNKNTVPPTITEYSFELKVVVDRYNDTKPSSEVLLTTGVTDRNSVLGIYDLAGNVDEWTLEKTSNTDYPCTLRGGSCRGYGSDRPVGSRYNYSTSGSVFNVGYRLAFW